MNRISKYLDDGLLAAGCGCVVAGVYILAGIGWALVVGGLMLIGLAVMVGKAKAKND